MNTLFRRRLILEGTTPIVIPPSPPSKYSIPLTFDILSDGDVVWSASDSNIKRTIEYSLNGGEWTEITSDVGNSAPRIAVVTGDEIQFRGDNDSYGDATNGLKYSGFKNTTAQFTVHSNIMSLINSTDFTGLIEFPENSKNNFAGLFYECSTLQNAEDLLLPVRALKEGSYRSLFYYCTSLLGGPGLSKISEVDKYSCYQMFRGCSSLTEEFFSPNVEQYAESCFEEMYMGAQLAQRNLFLNFSGNVPRACFKNTFNDCTFLNPESLYISIYIYENTTIGPEGLYGTFSNSNIAGGCYFDLNTPVQLSEYCFAHMFENCTSQTFYSHSSGTQSTTLAPHCYDSMFKGCILLEQATLPAATLATGCYQNMFDGCSNLNKIDCYATDTSATDCTTNWVRGVANSGVFTKHIEYDSWQTGNSGIPVGWETDNYIPEDLPLTFKILSSGNIICKATSDVAVADRGLSYDINNTGEWTSVELTAAGVEIPVNNGDIIRFQRTAAPGTSETAYCSFDSTCNFIVYGKIASLGNFSTTPTDYRYYKLFEGITGLIDAKGLALLPNKANAHIYQEMFSGCTNLRSAPKLPATRIGHYAYYKMFYGCTSLEVAPDLPGNMAISGSMSNIGDYSYYSMFEGCTSLIQVPSISANSLGGRSCARMFYGCTGITGFKKQFRVTKGTSNYCCNNMFRNCTSLVEANVFINTTAVVGVRYTYMFADCSSLTIPPILATNAPSSSDYEYMFLNCTSLTSITLCATSLSLNSCYRYMFKGCTNLSNVTCLASSVPSSADTPANNPTYHWLDDVSPTGTFTKIPGVQYPTTDYSGIPVGWTVAEKDYNSWLTIQALSSGYISFYTEGEANLGNGQYYSKNGGANSYLPSTTSLSPDQDNRIDVVAGDVVKFYGSGGTHTLEIGGVLQSVHFNISCQFNVTGNVMSIIDSSSYRYNTSLFGTGLYPLRNLFYNCTGLVDASGLILPATTLVAGCYYGMFNGCTSLTGAPELPAVTGAANCYSYMFANCTGLNSIKCLLSDTSAAISSQCDHWVDGVQTTSGTFVKNPQMTNWPSGVSGIPNNWTVTDAT